MLDQKLRHKDQQDCCQLWLFVKFVTSEVVMLLRVFQAYYQAFMRVYQGCISRDRLNSKQGILCDLIGDLMTRVHSIILVSFY